jgi:putative transposase
VSRYRANYPIAVMCRILGVSPSGYYAWVKRPPSGRAGMDAVLTGKTRAAHAASRGAYGAPRLRADLAEAGIRVGRKRVARLMRWPLRRQPTPAHRHHGAGRCASGA